MYIFFIKVILKIGFCDILIRKLLYFGIYYLIMYLNEIGRSQDVLARSLAKNTKEKNNCKLI